MALLKSIRVILVICVLINISACFEIQGLYLRYKDNHFENHAKNIHVLTKRSPGLAEWWKNAKIQVKCAVNKIIPRRIQNIFKRKTSSQENEADIDCNIDESETRKEHGSLDFIGRDFVRSIGRKIEQVETGIEKAVNTVQSSVQSSIDFVARKTGINLSQITGGLDANKTFFSGVADKFKERVQAIYPGTKWCGDGNKSKNYYDLGTFSETDSCCREHDLCPINIPAGESQYGLVNTGLFTRSHCDCDSKFYNCLKQVNDLVSKKIGFTYFSVLGPQCFKEDYQIKGCAEVKSGKCIVYEFERSHQTFYQWFDSPKF